MIPHAAAFRDWYVAQGGSPRSAASYLTYLRRADQKCGGIDTWLTHRSATELADWVDCQPNTAFGAAKDWSDTRAAVRKYAVFCNAPGVAVSKVSAPPEPPAASPEVVLMLLREAKTLGARYYRATGKPLGVTGEVAELEAAELLRLTLCDARTPGYDAIDPARANSRVQIKGRAVDAGDRYRGRCPAIKCDGEFDEVALVLLDRQTMDALEIWRTSRSAVAARLATPGSKSRNKRHSMGISQFKSIADRVWSRV